MVLGNEPVITEKAARKAIEMLLMGKYYRVQQVVDELHDRGLTTQALGSTKRLLPNMKNLKARPWELVSRLYRLHPKSSFYPQVLVQHLQLVE